MEELFKEIFIEGFKKYGAEIVSLVLMGVSLWLFPSLRRFVKESLLRTIDKIFGKSRPPQNNEAETWEEIPEEAVEDNGNIAEIPKWFKKRRKKEKRVNVTKDGVIALFLLCLGLFTLIVSLWKLDLINLIEFLVLVLSVLGGCFWTIVICGFIWAGLSDDSGRSVLFALFVGVFILGAFFADFSRILPKLSESFYSIEFLNLLWLLGVFAGCAFGFLAFRIRTRNVNAYINAAERGNAEAQYKLGVAYYKKGNYKLSYMWYHLAFLCGNDNANTAMEEMENAKDGAAAKISPLEAEKAKEEAKRKFNKIMQTKERMIEYYRIQASKGDKIAQYNLGYMYQYGEEDVQQDNYRAYVWYYVAMLSGDRQAKSRLAELKDKFFPSQREQAEDEAKRKFNAIQRRKNQN